MTTLYLYESITIKVIRSLVNRAVRATAVDTVPYPWVVSCIFRIILYRNTCAALYPAKVGICLCFRIKTTRTTSKNLLIDSTALYCYVSSILHIVAILNIGYVATAEHLTEDNSTCW